MKTKQIYYKDQYKKKLKAKILSVLKSGNYHNIILDQTIFFPEGGGQPNDRGYIKKDGDSIKIDFVRIMNDEIVHQTKEPIDLKAGDDVNLEIDWNWRHKYMRIHTAGHLLHDILTTKYKNLTPLKGGHGKKAYLEYRGKISPEEKDKIESNANSILAKNLKVVSKETTHEALSKMCQYLPPNLPKDKPLRMIKIGDYSAMPDGGVHVKFTKEIGKIWIANITNTEDETNIRYGVA